MNAYRSMTLNQIRFPMTSSDTETDSKPIIIIIITKAIQSYAIATMENGILVLECVYFTALEH